MASRMVMLMSGLLAAALPGISCQAADIVTDWGKATPPPAPTLSSATVDTQTTTLLLLDFNTPPCDPVVNPRCLATVPAVKALLARARAKGMFVVYTLGASTARDSIDPALKPRPDDPVISARPDKFLNSALEKILKDHGIKTVIATGTAANGAVLYTASEAAFQGYNVIVPIDGVSGLTPYAEQITLWQLMNGPRLGGDLVKLTTTGAIGF